MPRTHPPYPPEFRAEAVRLARGSEKSIPALAADLGVSSAMLRHWLRQDAADARRVQADPRTTDEREELRRLRREGKVLQQEREILRKAAASFAQETLIYWGYWFGGGGEAVETRATETATHSEAPVADGPTPVCTVSRGADHAS